jgi:hypothetical protein
MMCYVNSIVCKPSARSVPRLPATLLALALAGCMIIGQARHSAAQTVTIGEVRQTNNADPDFVFTNSDPTNTGDGGINSSFSVLNADVKFQFDVPNTYGPVGDQINAKLTLNSVVSGPVDPFDITFGIIDQGLKDITLTITDLSGHTLLAVDPFATGDLVGLVAGQTGTEGSDTLALDSLTLSSPYLNLAGATSESYQFGLGSISPALSVNANDYVNSFTASATGSFNAPEPSSWVMLAMGALGLFAVGRRFSLRSVSA